MDTNHCARTHRDRPDSSIVYKVWIEIEQYNEITDIGTNMDAPGASLAQFSTYEDAYAFAQSLRHTFETHGLPPDRRQTVDPGDLPVEVAEPFA